ncbi:hypothetical protein VD0002_g4792 [Verticillium dahliae]|uniref:Glutamyl-tRNA(Gln) amidotransferase subunit A n=2 Tax=Verticillium dahliae TaxID=27337 RepID=G2WUS8_VERDV|nr:glutamyl-tRNA(Gln) amidotransferase subunit A [Verticillium dahliae VdLs.17]KAH6690154.1 glutamyl-tRNA amidotransferase subunit A [Verticillium dahliae]EGY20053.1 glutamyl-tRNA(Gln) amidotransferase subunit A [Verticillium dahliae VdLs.17]PNH31101.1 hypothetical protein BJF96_g5674 [Verticillium dahliae]PNH53457.1 hypothetical protein VD0003_g3961 [Verticillium dahliae]PNH63609.1 hypothetical protein VD0002_g4792 [Verticillium dahliae]
MADDLYRLTASEVAAKVQSGQVTIEEYARSLLSRIEARDPVVKAWAYLDPERVMAEARRLDQVPLEERGPLHGVAIGVKDVIFTKDMPTQFNSPLYTDNAPHVDAASIIILRQAGALLVGKTTTTEFAATTRGPATTNPHDPSRTPGGSSAGSGAAVADFQCAVALGTQTGGSMIRPGSFNGVYAFKPTWGAVSREGQKLYSLTFDTLGVFARGVADLELMAHVFALEDDDDDDDDDEAGVGPPAKTTTGFQVQGARFAVCKTMVWPHAGPGTVGALQRAVELLRAQGANVEEISFPESLADLPKWHATVLDAEGRAAFLPEYRAGKDKIAHLLIGHVENRGRTSRAEHLKALDSIAAARPVVDAMLSKYAAVLVPSVPDEAPEGIEWTGNAAFNVIWTALHTPVVNVPGFKGGRGMPVGVSLVAPRYRDRHLLKVSKKVGEIFEAEGGWKPSN